MTAAAFDIPHILAFWLPGGWEWIVILLIGLLLFGKRLPEVGRSLGRGIVEFKKGIKGIEDEIDEESSRPNSRPERLDSRAAPSPQPAADRIEQEKVSVEQSESDHDDRAGT